MNQHNQVLVSKFLSLLLRHQPELVGLELDEEGWTDVDDLLAKVNASGKPWTRDLLDEVVAASDKQRFRFSEDGTRIRANQGHSVDIDLNIQPSQPPAILYHGTATRFLGSIRETGLTSQSRRHVHLSLDMETATRVGSRHGKPFILTIDAAAMFQAGYKFYLSDNNVWLTEKVLPRFIRGA